MRAWALPIALLLLTGVLAGCVNTPKETDGGTIDPAGVTGDDGDAGGSDGGNTATTTVKALAPLTFALSTTSPKWVAPGASIAVSASSATAASYVWSIGPLPGTVAPKPVKLDTGSAKDASDWIAAGASKSITFTEPGSFEMHCHPHPFMRSNVTVVQGYTGPKEVTVKIVDGAELGTYRYVPENILVAPGTVVTYENVGAQPHTSTLMKADPPLKKLDLTKASGSVAAEGDGWQRIRLVAVDAEGRFGSADLPVYVKPLPTYDSGPIAITFTAGGLPEEAVASSTKSFTLESNGTLNVTWAFVDAPAKNGVPANNAEVDIHVFPQGSEQDAITSETKPEGTATTAVSAGTYTLKVIAKKGVGIEGTVTITAVYSDPTPPAPTMAGAGGGDGHGGHAH